MYGNGCFCLAYEYIIGGLMIFCFFLRKSLKFFFLNGLYIKISLMLLVIFCNVFLILFDMVIGMLRVYRKRGKKRKLDFEV